MKSSFLSLAVATLFLFSTTNAKAEEKSTANKFTVHTGQSAMAWRAAKVTGKHNGSIKITNGEIVVEKGILKSGVFNIDMNSISVEDIKDAKMNADLVKHLKSDDFFGVDKHASSRFEIVSVTKGTQAGSYTVKGNLTIKGITKPIEFPAAIVVSGNTLKATGTAVVDRTKYDIRYKSKSFFDSIGDKAIYDEFQIDLQIVANLNS